LLRRWRWQPVPPARLSAAPAGCAGPFKEATPEAAQFGVWQPAQSSAASPAAAVPDQWWTVYGDSTLDQLQQAAAAGNPSVEQAVARLRSAQAAVASSRAAQLPTLSTTGSGSRALTGGGTYSNTNGENVARSGSINNNFSLGLSASWELDLWGKLSGAVDASRASAQASADDLAAARLSAQASVAQTYFSLRAAEAQMKYLQESLEAYEQSLKLTQNRYQAGVVSSADVAQAQSQYKSTQASLLDARSRARSTSMRWRPCWARLRPTSACR
jgi:outer membrane protein TolC